ncbi:SDR family oxidoreductase [Amycolatopsis magusensis]|uniref:SDR family oxidoreductase n=1 Tax=Amycolatopsis magusensis TaxID=882444 RepID=UPI0037BE0FD8
MTILVTGATGNVGREAVKHLLAAGQQVRALTRTPETAALPPEVEVVRGDLLEPETIVPALAGVTAMQLYAVPETAAEVAELAKQAGVRRIVVLSSDAVTDNHDDGFHLVVEKAVENSGLEWTHVRPGEFAINKRDSWSEPIRQGHVRLAFPDAKGMPVHETDIGAVAAAALMDDRHAGKVYRPTSHDTTSQREQVMAIADAIGKPVTIEVITPAQEKEDMLQVGWPEDVIDYLQSYFQTWTNQPPVARPDVAEATGKRAHTFAEWAVDHAADFE